MFGWLFDFNRDGKPDAFEYALGLGLVIGLAEEAAAEEEFEDEDAVSGDELEAELDELEDELSDLEDTLSDLEDREPENSASEAHARWERRKDLLETQIEELESQIADVEDQMDEL